MRTVTTRLGMAAAACVLVWSCGQPPPASNDSALPATPVTLAVSGTLNRMPSLAVSGKRVVAVWTSTQNDVMDVYAAISGDGGATFSDPRRVNHLPGDARSNAEQPPRVALSGSAITVIWPSQPDAASAIRMSRSTDGGRTFSPAVTLHDSSITGARGWQSVTVGRDGAVHATWLDGRAAEPMPARKAASGHGAGGHAGHSASGAHKGAPRQDVYQAVILQDGRVTESHVSRDVCFCCKTAVGVGPSGRVNVAWRHIFPERMRDIAMATSSDGGRTFGPPVRVSEDKWQLSGCPDDGPAMAIDASDAAHLVWPTLVNQAAPQKAIFYTSTTDGRSFAPRIRLSSDDQDDAAHPQIAVDAAGNVAAAWDEQQGDARRIVIRTAAAASGRFEAPRALSTSGSAFYPFVVGLQGGFLVAWPSGSGESSEIHIQSVRPLP